MVTEKVDKLVGMGAALEREFFMIDAAQPDLGIPGGGLDVKHVDGGVAAVSVIIVLTPGPGTQFAVYKYCPSTDARSWGLWVQTFPEGDWSTLKNAGGDDYKRYMYVILFGVARVW